jgi:hypothetical protein
MGPGQPAEWRADGSDAALNAAAACSITTHLTNQAPEEETMSLYEASVPVYVQLLGSMQNILDKAIAHCASKKYEAPTICNDRLFPDMFTFARQVQAVADHASGSCLRCAGKEANLPPRDETTLEALKERVTRALAAVQSVSKADIDAHADKDVTFPMGPRQVTMKGWNYMLHFALPNFYFHHTTAYNILRHRGVELGKRDFLGVVPGFPKQ